MLFHTQQFLIFFALVFTLYWALPWSRARVWLLVFASFYFYMSWNARLAALIGASAVIDYILGRLIESAPSPDRRKFLLIISIVWNVGQLGYFKYANFFLDSLGHALGAIGLSASLPTLHIILPIGISFYTFEAISYTVDVYRGRIRAERNLINFVLFITFFPRLIAGPIIRGRQFLPQVRRTKRWDWARLQLGANYFLLGLIKKLAIADRMAIFADAVFQNPGAYGWAATWLGLLAYAVQIYCDFSGYSDMAVGLGHALGYKLPQNFRTPYLAANIAEFWSRWHISLTRWLRDYLYVPLGGNSGPPWRAAANVILTMAICGLWHGAQWHFVLFGIVQAFLLIGHRFFQKYCSVNPRLHRCLASAPGTAARIVFTFLIFVLTLVLFRCPTLPDAGIMYRRLFAFVPGPAVLPTIALFWWLAAAFVIGHALSRKGWWNFLWNRTPALAQGFAYATALTVALLLAPDSGRAFIYFQF